MHPRLTIDTFDGKAFVGVVAFTMQKVRPWSWLPGAPTATEFFEINVRTYVHLGGEEPGIVFFSLDATSSLAVGSLVVGSLSHGWLSRGRLFRSWRFSRG